MKLILFIKRHIFFEVWVPEADILSSVENL